MNIPIWPGSSSFFPGLTPFGFYDNDYQFQTEADKVANWCARRLGYPLMEIELQDINFYTAFEEAVTVYGNEVYQWKIRENFFSMQGNSTGSSFNNQVITPNLGSTVRLAQTYAVEAGSGGNVTQYTASFDMIPGVQDYDLKAIMSSSYGITSSIEVKKIFYEQAPAIVRYFDPYAGTYTQVGSDINLKAFDGFGYYEQGYNPSLTYDILHDEGTFALSMLADWGKANSVCEALWTAAETAPDTDISVTLTAATGAQFVFPIMPEFPTAGGAGTDAQTVKKVVFMCLRKKMNLSLLSLLQSNLTKIYLKE